MKIIFRNIVSVFCLVQSLNLNAQYFGGIPPSQKWSQVNTDTVRIIFPDSWKGDVAQMAAKAAALGATQYTLGNQFRKINIVLQNQTTISNGYVALGPRRSEFLMTPPQNSFEMGSIPWSDQLMLHEFRHVQQYNNFNKGLSRVFYFLTGELGLTLLNNAAIPNWFWEGDAVYQETQQSLQGRGRMPYFFNGYRSLRAAGKQYSWMKLRCGSLRDYVPDHYQLGYLLTAYGREQWGPEAWKKITDDAVRFRGVFYPFQSAIRRHTGLSYAQYRKEALHFFDQGVATGADSVSRYAQQQKHFAGDEEFPQWVNPRQLVLMKRSYRQVPAFYLRDLVSGEDRLIRVRDISIDNYFSLRNGKIVYAALGFDPRWDWRDYSEIRLLDLQTGLSKTLTRKSRYFSPDINDEGREIVAVAVHTDGSSELTLLDADSGKVVQRWPNPENYFYTTPKFKGSRYIISPVRNQKGEMALLQLDREQGTRELLLPFSMNVIGFPNVNGDTVAVTMSRGQQDLIFLLAGRQLFQVNAEQVSLATGNYQLAMAQGQLAWTVFTAAGQRAAAASLAEATLVPVAVGDLAKPLPDFGVKSLSRELQVTPAGSPTYPVTRYRRSFQLINFHSWIPGLNDPEYSITLLSDNILNTLQAEWGLTYNTNERSKKISGLATYGALYPWLRTGGAYTFDRSASYYGKTVYWNESEWRAGVQLPLNFSGGRLYRFLRAGTDYVFARPQFRGLYKDSFDTNGYGYLNNYLLFSWQVQRARQQIYPRWAQQWRLEYNRAVAYREASQFLANGYLYLPGIGVTHSFVLNTAFQQRDTLRQLSFSNNFPFSRGYLARNFHQMMKVGINYHFPILYPDWGFASLVYLLRVRANTFFDLTHIRDYTQNRALVSRDYRSFGAELFFDTRCWNQVSLSFGIRYARLLDGGVQGLTPNRWELVLPVNLVNR